MFEKLMTSNNWEHDFEYDWIIKKRQKDELARQRLEESKN
jgi:hypothetical protein